MLQGLIAHGVLEVPCGIGASDTLERGKTIDVLVAHDLQVRNGRAPVIFRIGCLGILKTVERHGDGRVADSVHMHLEALFLGIANHGVVIVGLAVGNAAETRLVGVVIQQVSRTRFDDTIEHELDVVALIVLAAIGIANLGAAIDLVEALVLGLAIEAGGYLELELTLDVELLESNLSIDLIAKNRLVNIGNTDRKQVLLQRKNGALELFDRIGTNRLEDIVHGPIAHKTRRLLRLGIQNDGSSLLAHKAATDAGLLEALAVDPIGVAVVGTDKHRHVRAHCVQQLLGLNLALVLEHGVVPTHALIELASGMLFHIFADGIHVLVHGLETQNVDLVGKLASTRREVHMSIAEARHEHAVARLDHLGVGTDVLAHPRLVTHIDEDAILNRYCLSRKLCAIGREHLPLKYGIRLHHKLLSCDPLLSPKRISLERLRSERRFIL